MSEQSKERMNSEALPAAKGDALDGVRRATEDASPFAPPNPEVAATAQRRHFSAADRAPVFSTLLTLADDPAKTDGGGCEGAYSAEIFSGGHWLTPKRGIRQRGMNSCKSDIIWN